MAVQKTLASEAEWLEWRSKLIGSSDAPIIMGASPHTTAYELWQEKRGLKKFDRSNFATERGKHWEPKVRAKYELESGLDFPPKNFEDHPLGASLDGYNEEQQLILEIKCPGKEVFELCKAGEVAEQYVWQLEHQLFVADAKEVHFVCAKLSGKGIYDGEIEELAVVKYQSDPVRRALLIKAEQDFWQLLVEGKQPPLTDRDVLEREDDLAKAMYQGIRDVQAEMDRLNAEYEVLEERYKEFKDAIIRNMRHTAERCLGVEVKRQRHRTIDQAKLKASGVPLDEYMKGSFFYSVKVK